MTSKIYLLTLAATAFTVALLLSTSFANTYAQTNLPPQSNGRGNGPPQAPQTNIPQFGNIPANIPTPPPPGSPQETPINASMQAQQNVNDNYARGILDQINSIMAQQHNNSTRNFIGLLHQFHLQGKIDCPHPAQAPFGQCFLVPRGAHGPPSPLPPVVPPQAQGHGPPGP